MKKLFSLSILFMFNYSVFGQSEPVNDTINTKDSRLHFTPKIGFGRIWESNNGLYGFIGGADLLYAGKQII